MNYQKFYKVTISNDQLRQAFLSYYDMNELIARIVDSLYTGMNLDVFLTKKYMLARRGNQRRYLHGRDQAHLG